MTPDQLVIFHSVLVAERDNAERNGSATKAVALQAALSTFTSTGLRHLRLGAAFEDVAAELDDELMDGTIEAGEFCCRVADRAKATP